MQSIVDLRTQRGWSQKDLADRLNSSPVNISRWESGKRKLPLDIALKLASVFGITVSELIGETGCNHGNNKTRSNYSKRPRPDPQATI